MSTQRTRVAFDRRYIEIGAPEHAAVVEFDETGCVIRRIARLSGFSLHACPRMGESGAGTRCQAHEWDSLPDNDHTDTPATTSFEGLFVLSVGTTTETPTEIVDTILKPSTTAQLRGFAPFSGASLR